MSDIPPDVISDLEEAADRRRILKRLEEGGAVRIGLIAKDLRMTPGNVHHHTDILVKQDLIRKWTTKLRRSYAQISEKGKRALQVLKQRGTY